MYDLIQRSVGVSVVYRQVAPWVRFAPGMRVLDVGGGTGTLKQLFAPGVQHFCLDVERPKLERYVQKFEDARPIQGDGTALPVRDGKADAVTLALVTHHLNDAQLEGVLNEVARVLADNGVLVLYDAVWAPTRFGSRLLWKVDRGSHPRLAEQLATAIRRNFDVVEQQQFTVIHRYVAFRCKRRGAGSSS
jgi:ubiquinone/menaquinone biosynthesis C-methylase UbiE